MLKEVPNVKLPPEYQVNNSETFNDGDKALFKFINGDFGVDELTKRLRDHIRTENANSQT